MSALPCRILSMMFASEDPSQFSQKRMQIPRPYNRSNKRERERRIEQNPRNATTGGGCECKSFTCIGSDRSRNQEALNLAREPARRAARMQHGPDWRWRGLQAQANATAALHDTSFCKNAVNLSEAAGYLLLRSINRQSGCSAQCAPISGKALGGARQTATPPNPLGISQQLQLSEWNCPLMQVTTSNCVD